MTPEPGIYYDIPAEEYFSWQCFSKSMIPATLKSAKHLKHYLTSESDSKSKRTGSLVDAMLLDPVEFAKYELLPETYINSKKKPAEFTLRSSTCRNMLKEIVEQNKIPVTKAENEHALKIVNAVRQNKIADSLLKGRKQVAIVWDNTEYGIRCKARLDLLHDDCIPDLKTTKDASYNSFSRDIHNFYYHCQAAMYTDGMETLDGIRRTWKFIVVENIEPFDCVVYSLGEDSIECGRIIARMAMNKYRSYVESDPELLRGYSEFDEPIEVPTWAIEKTFKEGDNAGI